MTIQFVVGFPISGRFGGEPMVVGDDNTTRFRALTNVGTTIACFGGTRHSRRGRGDVFTNNLGLTGAF